jgi:hypothetical protein
MPFRNDILAGTTLIRQSIQSANYEPNEQGWALLRDGDADILGNLNVGGPTATGSALTVRDTDNDTILQADERGVGITRLYTDKLTIKGVAFGVMTRNLQLYIDADSGNDANEGLTKLTAKKTINGMLASLPKIISSVLDIQIKNATNTYFEDILMMSFTGGGIIRLWANNESGWTTAVTSGARCKIFGSLAILGCTLREIAILGLWEIKDSGTTSDEKTSASWIDAESYPIVYFPGTITIQATRHVSILGVDSEAGFDVFSEGRRRFSIFAGADSKVFCRWTYCIDANDSVYAAYRHSALFLLWPEGEPMGGSGTHAFWAVMRGEIWVEGGDASNNTKFITAGGRDWTSYGGSIGGPGVGNSVGIGSPPAPTPAQRTDTFIRTGSASWRDVFGDYRTDNNFVYQGQWAGNGIHRGYWYFGNPWGILAGRTIDRVEIHCRRRAAGGVTGAQAIEFRSHNDTGQVGGTPGYTTHWSTQNFIWGEDKWFDVPTGFGDELKNGVAKGIGIHTSDGTDYAIFEDWCDIKITSTG